VAPKDSVTWRTISNDGVAMWHDHRSHWMSPDTPPTIDDRGTVQQWAIPLVVDGERVLVSGTLYLRDRASVAWWLFAPLAAGLTALASRRARTRFLVVPVVSFVGAVVGLAQLVGLPSGARITPLLLGFCTGALVLGVAARIVRGNAHVAVSLEAGAGTALVVVTWMCVPQVRSAYVPGMDTA